MTNPSPQQQPFTPALGFACLTPWYDLVVRLLTRERRWRSRLLEAIKPGPDDHILDVGCGTGQLALAILRQANGAHFVGVDPDPQVLALARRRLNAAGLPAELLQGFLDASLFERQPRFNKAVSSLVLHQVPVPEKHRILGLMHELLQPGGAVFIADYAEQPTQLMRALFASTVQRIDGRTNTQPNVRGILPQLLQAVGFTGICRLHLINTLTGAISIYAAVKATGPAISSATGPGP